MTPIDCVWLCQTHVCGANASIDSRFAFASQNSYIGHFDFVIRRISYWYSQRSAKNSGGRIIGSFAPFLRSKREALDLMKVNHIGTASVIMLKLRFDKAEWQQEGLVAQWTRAHGYELWCQGFDSLQARLQNWELTLQNYRIGPT